MAQTMGPEHLRRIRRRRSTSRPAIAIAASISSCSACHPSPLRAAIRAGAATGKRRREDGRCARARRRRPSISTSRSRSRTKPRIGAARRGCIPMLRTFSVFHASQIDGVPALAPPTATKTVPERVKDVELIIEASGVPVRIGVNAPSTARRSTSFRCLRTKPFTVRNSALSSSCTSSLTPAVIPRG